MKEKWVVSAKKADFQAIGQHFGIDPVLARIMRNRGLTEDEEYHISLLKKALKEYEDSGDEQKKCKTVTVII